MTTSRWCALLVLLVLALPLAGCGTIKAWQSGSPDTVTRFLADIACITALANAGVQVQGDPMVNGAKTALGVLTAISTIGSSNMPGTVLSTCAATLGLGPRDAEAAQVVATNSPGTETPKAVLPRAVAPPPQPTAPQPVVVPVPKKATK